MVLARYMFCIFRFPLIMFIAMVLMGKLVTWTQKVKFQKSGSVLRDVSVSTT